MGKRKDWRRPPYYIVCGMPRGGTSMMMQALIAGGMTAYYVNREDKIQEDAARGYKSNPVDAYEWERLINPIPKKLRGKLFKMFPWHMIGLEPGPFKVVLITREVEQIRRSLDKYIEYGERTHGKGRVNQAITHAKRIVETDDLNMLFNMLEVTLRQEMPQVKDMIRFDYDEVCEDPHRAFAALAARGWPIDVEKAAAVPNRKWRLAS